MLNLYSWLWVSLEVQIDLEFCMLNMGRCEKWIQWRCGQKTCTHSIFTSPIFSSCTFTAPIFTHYLFNLRTTFILNCYLQSNFFVHMATYHYSPSARAFIVRNYHLTSNYAEVRRRFAAEYGRQGPTEITVKRLLLKELTGDLRNARAPTRERTVRNAANIRVSN